MRGFGKAVARDGRDDDLECNAVLVVGEKWENPVELVEGAWPAVNEHQRKNPLAAGV